MSDKEKESSNNPEEQSNFPTISLPDSSTVIGGEIGPYKLLSVLGEGGFGIVYLAEQKHPVKRTVALKIIKPGMDTKQVIARFEAERQALALLEHPNIARVYNAGSTETGRPYFVMEYIKGMPITEYCDDHKLSIKERLELFIEVCEAVQHAHQKGIIHRDIKPSNIVVSSQDGKAAPKVIDFGVAKAISMPLTEKTMFTQQGQLIGTPEYMSPEQADLKEKDIDTRTDIYSLGVVLYELLAGTLPFEPETLREGGYAEIQRIIREQEPPRPSTKLSGLGENATKVALSRQIELSTLVKSLHKELEWIPLMAIRKERDQRYKTASDLAEDVQNYLDGNPLVAGPESAVYKFKKFIKKRRGIVVAVGSIAVVLLAGIIISSTLYVQTEQAKEQEITQRKIAEQESKRANEEADNAKYSLYFNLISLINAEYENSNIIKAQELLTICPPHLRNWEWHFLKNVCDRSKFTFEQHTAPVNSITFSPDGKLLASASEDKTIRIWDVINGTEKSTFPNYNSCVHSVAFSPDSELLASGGADGEVKLWNTSTGQEICSFKGHKSVVNFLRFTHDGRILKSGSYDRSTKVWDLVKKQEVNNALKNVSTGWIIDYTKNGEKMVSCLNDHPVRIWDTLKGTLLNEISHEKWYSEINEGPPQDILYSPDHTKIAICSASRSIVILDSESLQLEQAIRPAAKNAVDCIAYSPDGKKIASGTRLGTLKVWDALRGDLQYVFRGHLNLIQDVTFSPDGNLIATASRDNTVKIWNIKSGGQEKSLLWQPTSCIAYSPDGNYLAVGGGDGLMVMRDATNWDIMFKTIKLHTDTISSIKFRHDGRFIVTGSYDSSIIVWNWAYEKLLPALILKGHTGRVHSVDYSPDGKYIVSGGDDKIIRIWNSNTGDLLSTFSNQTNIITSVCYSPDGNMIASAGNDGIINIWNAKTGKLVKELKGHEGKIRALAFKNPKEIISASEDKSIILWDTESGKQKVTFKGHGGSVTDVKFSKDGSRVFSTSSDWTMKVWDPIVGNPILTLQPIYGGPINALDTSPNGNNVAVVCGYGGSMVEWTSQEIKTANSQDKVNMDEFKNKSLGTIKDSCESKEWDDWSYLGLLASKYSEIGKYDNAIKWQKKAILLLPSKISSELRKEYDNQLYLYEIKKDLKENPQQISSYAEVFNEHHYLLYMEPMNWEEAKLFAISVGGHLATITTKEENDWIIKKYPVEMGNYWLGGTDEKIEGKWEWVTAEEWNYTNWAFGEPNNDNNQDALQMFSGNQWDDTQMYEEKYFLIEWDK